MEIALVETGSISRAFHAVSTCFCVLIVSVYLTADQNKPQDSQSAVPTPVQQAQNQKQQPPVASSPAPNPPPQQNPLPKGSATWSISGPPERLRIPDDLVTQFTVSAGDKPLNEFKLIQSTLQDTSSLAQLGTNAMSLCAEDKNKKCESPITIDANTVRPITLKVDSDFKTPGVFTVEVRFSAKDQSDSKSFKLTVYSRPRDGMVWGALAIVAGLFIYFITHVWLRARLARDEALLPVYELRGTLDTLREKIATITKQTGYEFGGFRAAFSQVQTQLADAQIRNYLPPAFPKPGSPSDEWVSAFKTYLNPVRDRIDGLVVLTNSGVVEAAEYWSKDQAATRNAFGVIDGLASTVNSSDSAQAKLAPIIQNLVSTINQPAAQALAPFLAAAPVGLKRFFTEPPDEQSVRVDLYRGTLWLWILWILIAFVAGIYVVILSNLGFGTGSDLIKCFFWGLGFSVAGGQLEQLTLSTVTGSFGVSVPKA